MSTSDRTELGTIRIGLVRAGRVVRRWEVAGGTATIGSAEGSTIRAKGDPSIAPSHASLYVEDGELVLVAEEGADVLLNGEQVDFAVPGPDDEIRAGRLALRVEYQPPAGAELPEQDEPTDILGPDEPTDIVEPDEPGEPEDFDDEAPTEPPGTPVVDDTPDAPFQLPPDIAQLPGEQALEDEADADTAPPGALTLDEPTDDLDLGEPVPPTEETADEPLWAWEDDEDDEEDFVEPFDLAEELLHRRERPEPGRGACTGMVVRVMQGRVVETRTVLPGRPYQARDGEVECRIESGQLVLVAHRDLTGTVWKDEAAALENLPADGGAYRLALSLGHAALLKGDTSTWRVDVFPAPRVPLGISLHALPILVLLPVAFIAHAAFGFGVSLLNPELGDPELSEQEEIFAEVMMDKPEEERERPPRVSEATRMAEKIPPITARTVKEIRERPKVSDVDSVLSTLAGSPGLGTGEPGVSGDISGALGNIPGVPTDGPGGPWNLQGGVQRLEGDGVQYARHGLGGSGTGTLGGDQVGQGAGYLEGGGGTGDVRGTVTMRSSKLTVDGGHLSREEVSRVVSANLHRIQGCYERELINKPGLSGRIIYEWTVAVDGSVKGVHVQQSSLPSAAVADCITGLIRGWRFAAPQGGEVVISYPFLFRSAH